MSVLKLQDVKYTYKTQYQQVQALKGISYEFSPGTVHAIVGKSGSGKTTLLSLMAGLDLPTEGKVLCQGVCTEDMNLEKYRREKVAVIYQSFRLFPLLTVAENIMYPMELRGMKAKQAREKAARLVARVGLPETALDRYPTMLSGGEQQRVAIARALLNSPELIIADEPTGNLDPKNKEIIFNMLRKEHERGRGIILITHDQFTAAQAKTVYHLEGGVLHEKNS